MRVLIVDDHTLFADAIRPVLEGEGMCVVGVATTAHQALDSVDRERPDLILMDLGLPDQSGLAAGEQILDRFPEVRVVALTALDDRRTVHEALRAGFHGYLTKDTPVAEFVHAIRAVLGGQVVLPRRLGPGGERGAADYAALLAEQLTPRELEVLVLLVEGANGRAIARSLGISANTVRTHVQSILTKLQVHSRLEAATFAVRHRLVGRVPR